MKAILFSQYGSPEVLEFAEIRRPTPKDNEVLVKVHAASVNPLDWHRMRGKPFLVRTSMGPLKPKNQRLGADIAGRVDAVGKSITEFQPGDEVFGSVFAGGFAEYVCAGETRFARKPVNVSFEAAAAVPVAALTALQGLRDKGRIQPGQQVLINGASGDVGTFAIQIAKSYDAEVTGVCSTGNVEMVHSIGADRVIHWTRMRVKSSHHQFRHRLEPDVVTVSGSPDVAIPPGMLNSALRKVWIKKKASLACLVAAAIDMAVAGCSYSFTPGQKDGNAEWAGTAQKQQAAEKDRDQAIALRVRAALAHDPVLNPLGLRLFVNHGEVSLCGRFPDQKTRDRAIGLIEQIRGVTGVDSDCRD